MKKYSLSFFVFFCTFLVSLSLQAQDGNDNSAPYKKDSSLPSFRILQTDSTTWFTRDQLPASNYTIIIYFSPDCGHCQYEAKEMVRNMDSLKNTFLVWVSYKSITEIKLFSQLYGLDRFKNVRIGRDPLYGIPSFYQVKFTPFIAVYNKKKLFLKAWETGVEMPELTTFLRQQHP